MIKQAKSGTLCDMCKEIFGLWRTNGKEQVPNARGRRQAYITTISETHTGKAPVIRSLCYDCVQEASKWVDGSTWTLQEQIDYAKKYRQASQLHIGGF